jgi:beta-glucanase (GH16 family)
MSYRLLFFIPVAMIVFSCNKGKIPGSEKEQYKLVWQDEFDYSGLPDSTRWSYDTAGNGSGWGNNELEYYTYQRLQNSRVDSGTLKIFAIKEKYQYREYTSARLVTKFKGDWLYGKIEVKARMPKGVGTWPAIWMLPTDSRYGGWPECGEIDIIEQVGYKPDTVFGTIHTGSYNGSKGTQKSKGRFISKSSELFHLYTMEWKEDSINWYLDNEKFFSFSNEGSGYAEWPFDQRFHLLLNIAVGGNWGGVKGVDNNSLPYKMEVDYVRVYQR